jgi:hypothetical protein
MYLVLVDPGVELVRGDGDAGWEVRRSWETEQEE